MRSAYTSEWLVRRFISVIAMIILRQKEYATGAERAMIAMNKGKNISPKPISERAALISQDKRNQAIRKINQ